MMSGDKDIENQIPEDLTQEDDLAMDGDGNQQPYADEDFDAADFSADDGFADDVGGDDFIEEDWEAYDEEGFIDDSDGDGSEERKAAFYKLIIGSLVIFAVGVGGYVVMSARKEENLGAPIMEKVAGAAQVNPSERVEFHNETKVKPKDAFGVTYGKQDEAHVAAPEEEQRREGLLNDPQALARLRNREAAVPTQLVVVDESNGKVADGDLPMPAPMAQAEAPDVTEAPVVPRSPRPEPVEGLIPMPERLGEASVEKDNDEPADPVRATGDKLAVQSVETPADTVNMNDDRPEAVSAVSASQAKVQSGDVAQLNEKLDRITDRLGQIESNLDQLDDLQTSVTKLENRLATLEKAPKNNDVSSAVKSAPRSVEKTAPARTAAKPASKPVAPQSGTASWVLKSAQPGQAMVARKGGDDMYSVTVGENLDGIGKVTGIFVENGRWVVQGSAGRISQ